MHRDVACREVRKRAELELARPHGPKNVLARASLVECLELGDRHESARLRLELAETNAFGIDG